jgi:hypothetical protein
MIEIVKVKKSDWLMIRTMKVHRFWLAGDWSREGPDEGSSWAGPGVRDRSPGPGLLQGHQTGFQTGKGKKAYAGKKNLSQQLMIIELIKYW